MAAPRAAGGTVSRAVLAAVAGHAVATIAAGQVVLERPSMPYAPPPRPARTSVWTVVLSVITAAELLQ